ncbi:MAG: hypothetical protein JNM07_14085 [Phycisphaerae bacterium]|nr:hypothetical protein [Phycisphaerae bacterium]
MPSPRPRSKRSRSPRSPDRGESQGERSRLRRNRPLTVRSALLLLVPLALLAAGADVALYAFVRDHYAQHGHLAFPLDIGGVALALAAATIYGCVAVAKELRKRTSRRDAGKPVDAARPSDRSGPPSGSSGRSSH